MTSTTPFSPEEIPTVSMPPAIPYNSEAEEAVIGAVLINPACYRDLAVILTADMFYIIRNRWIWATFASLADGRHMPIDVLTVSDELNSKGRLEEIGGLAYLTGLVNKVPTSLHADAYAQIVADAHARREWIKYANNVVRLSYRSDLNAEAFRREITGLHTPVSVGRVNATSSEEIALALIGGMTDKPMAIPCHVTLTNDDGSQTVYGVPSLTEKLGGLPIGNAIILGAATQAGKTALAFELAEVAHDLGYRVLYVTTESSASELIMRRVCGRLGISTRITRRGADGETIRRVQDGISAWMTRYAGLLFDEHSYTVDEIAASVYKYRPNLVVVDHVGELRYTGDNKTLGLSENFAELRKLCREARAALLSVVQLALVTDGRPQLKDIRWASGDLSEKADIVLMLHRPDLYLARNGSEQEQREALVSRAYPVPLEIWVRKDRGGPVDILCEAMYNLAQQTISAPNLDELQNYFGRGMKE